MTKPNAVDERDFVSDFARYRREARKGPVTILSNGAVAGYFIQAEDFEQLSQVRRSFATVDLPDEQAAAIGAGRMDRRHDHLDALLDEP